jgi:serine/threonine protein kinase
MFFAVKSLKFQVKADDLHNREVESLIRLNNENHDHLIRLLVTFQHKKQLHLVFPWANGNLQDFWKTSYPDAQIPPRDHNLAKWMVTQCLGLATGLQKIHHNPVKTTQAQQQGLQPDTPQKKHGKHGDLKPENILWFKPNGNGSMEFSMGVLKISDFGFADFHASKSKSGMPSEHVGVTETYRAPEWDIKQTVASAYDMWCMGCILLEFVEWYLKGAKGVEEFVQKRIEDSINEMPEYKEDNFFNRTHLLHDSRKAEAKGSVLNVSFPAPLTACERDRTDNNVGDL